MECEELHKGPRSICTCQCHKATSTSSNSEEFEDEDWWSLSLSDIVCCSDEQSIVTKGKLQNRPLSHENNTTSFNSQETNRKVNINVHNSYLPKVRKLVDTNTHLYIGVFFATSWSQQEKANTLYGVSGTFQLFNML
jgi:hypothetical protein